MASLATFVGLVVAAKFPTCFEHYTTRIRHPSYTKWDAYSYFAAMS